MKSLSKLTITTFSGAAALAFAVGFGGIATTPMGTTPAAAAHASSNAPVAPSTPGSTVHQATLVGCISGLDC
jgi:hypothetical protein